MQLVPQFTMTALNSLLFGRFLQRFALQALMTASYFLMGSDMLLMTGFQPRTST